MKKVFATTACCLLAITLASCGNKQEVSTSDPSSTMSETSEVQQDAEFAWTGVYRGEIEGMGLATLEISPSVAENFLESTFYGSLVTDNGQTLMLKGGYNRYGQIEISSFYTNNADGSEKRIYIRLYTPDGEGPYESAPDKLVGSMEDGEGSYSLSFSKTAEL